MTEDLDEQKRVTVLLLQESIWQLEDKLNVILESIADQEAEVVRLKRLSNLMSDRLSKLEARQNHGSHSISN